MGEITRINIIKDDRAFQSYQRGDIGQPAAPLNTTWFLACPGCNAISPLLEPRTIIEHKDGTISTSKSLHCHGRNALRQYHIEKNEVKWVE